MSEGPGERSVLGPTQERTAARTHGDSNVLSCSPGDWTELLRYCSCSCLQQLLHWLICSRPAPPPRPTPPPPPTPAISVFFFVRVSAHHWQLKALGTVPLVVPEKCQSFWRGRGLHRRCRKAQMALMDEQNPTEGPGQRHAGAPSK